MSDISFDELGMNLGEDPDVPRYVKSIVFGLLPDLMTRFAAHSIDYGDAYKELGEAGQFSDIWRKIAKLKRAVWDGHAPIGESVDQMVEDVINHCLLLLYIRWEARQFRPAHEPPPLQALRAPREDDPPTESPVQGVARVEVAERLGGHGDGTEDLLQTIKTAMLRYYDEDDERSPCRAAVERAYVRVEGALRP